MAERVTLHFVDAVVSDSDSLLKGMLLVGWIYKVRNQGDAALYFGQIMEHSDYNLDPIAKK